MELITNEREYLGAVIGTLLGDASLDIVSGLAKNSRLRFGQANKDYALWKQALLSWRFPLKAYDNANGMTYVYSPRVPYFTRLRDRMYYSGRKTIDGFTMKALTPLGLALWYYDDGDWHVKHNRLLLNTQGFNYAEHELMQQSLFKRFGLRFNTHTRKSRSGGKLYYFRLKNADRTIFFELIEPYRVDCMAYKFPTTEGAYVISNRSRLSTTDVDAALPVDRLLELQQRGLSIYKMGKVTGINSGTILGRLRKLRHSPTTQVTV